MILMKLIVSIYIYSYMKPWKGAKKRLHLIIIGRGDDSERYRKKSLIEEVVME